MRSRARVGYDSLSINVLELFGMVWTAYVMVVIRTDLPRGEGGHSSAVQWVLICIGRKNDVRAGCLMRILGELEVKGQWGFQVKPVVGMNSYLASMIARCEPRKINAELKRQMAGC